MPIQKSKRQAQKSEKHLSFPDALAPVTRKLSFAEITGNLSKRRSQISKRRQSFSASSTSITCTLSLTKITNNLSKISDKEESTKADIQNLSSSPRMLSQRSLSGHSVFLIPWGTSASQ
ncbi:hypothetical protein ACFX2F_019845 [Malus domestica]